LQIRGETNNAVLIGLVGLRNQAIALFGGVPTSSTAYQDYLAAQEAARTEIGSGRAYGGMVNGGQRVLVGENGPEVVYFRQPGMVATNRALRSGGNGNSVSVDVNVSGLNDEQMIRATTKAVDGRMRDYVRAMKQRQGRQL